MLDVMNPDSPHGCVYLDLVHHPGSGVASLAERTGMAIETVRGVLGELANQDMVVVVDPVAGTWEAQPPTRVVEDALARELLWHNGLRKAGAELEHAFRRARREEGTYDALEILEGGPRFIAAVKQLHRTSRRHVRIIDMPPYYGTPEDNVELEALQIGRMDAGVGYRTLYYHAAVDDPVTAPIMTRLIEAGEQTRTLTDLPMKLHIGDDDLAIVALPAEERVGLDVLLIRPSGLLKALTVMFESLWNFAVPASSPSLDGHLDARDRQILSLMASGATDEAIARRLDLSHRTILRRVSALQKLLGATTRFQAGVQAARRGWL